MGRILISFLFPYREVGGAKNVLDFLPVELESFLREEGLDDWIPSTLEIFDHEPIFTKTKDRKALGHMNDFKNINFASSLFPKKDFCGIVLYMGEDIIALNKNRWAIPIGIFF